MVVEVLHGAFAIPHHEAHPLPKVHALSNCHSPCGLVESYQAPHQEVLHATQARLELLITGQMMQRDMSCPWRMPAPIAIARMDWSMPINPLTHKFCATHRHS